MNKKAQANPHAKTRAFPTKRSAKKRSANKRRLGIAIIEAYPLSQPCWLLDRSCLKSRWDRHLDRGFGKLSVARWPPWALPFQFQLGRPANPKLTGEGMLKHILDKRALQ
jgi:hypothetical protein